MKTVKTFLIPILVIIVLLATFRIIDFYNNISRKNDEDQKAKIVLQDSLSIPMVCNVRDSILLLALQSIETERFNYAQTLVDMARDTTSKLLKSDKFVDEIVAKMLGWSL